jgi:hypothetical protein
MATQYAGDFARFDESEIGAGEYRCRESESALIIFAAGKDRAGCIEKSEPTVSVPDGQMLADALCVIW